MFAIRIIHSNTLIVLVFFLLAGCNGGAVSKNENKAINRAEIPAVSVWDRISTRSQPRRSSDAVTLLSLGEKFYYLDSSDIDTAYKNTRFLKVRLSDSTEVWAYGFATVIDAQPAVITREVPLYIRPDLLTITDKNLKPMEIVAVKEEWDEWMNVVNEKKRLKGWIKKDNLTYNTTDIAFALLAKRKLEGTDQDDQISVLNELLESNPYPNSIFVSHIQDLIEKFRREERDNNERDD